MRMKENGQGRGAEGKEGWTREYSEASTSHIETAKMADLILETRAAVGEYAAISFEEVEKVALETYRIKDASSVAS